jgi:hypothetical protein
MAITLQAYIDVRQGNNFCPFADGGGMIHSIHPKGQSQGPIKNGDREAEVLQILDDSGNSVRIFQQEEFIGHQDDPEIHGDRAYDRHENEDDVSGNPVIQEDMIRPEKQGKEDAGGPNVAEDCALGFGGFLDCSTHEGTLFFRLASK